MHGDTLPVGLRWAMIGSGVTHVVLVLALMIAGTVSAQSRKPPVAAINAKLVKLGKKREKDLLPRIPAAPPPPAKKAVALDNTSKPAAPPPPEPKASAADRLKEMSSVTSALSRLKAKESEEEPEGDPEGTPDGEVTSLSQALIGNRYSTEIYRCVKASYTIEGIPPKKIAGRKASVFTRVDAKGKFFDFKIEKSSGLGVFDRAVERAVRRCGKVSPPPKEILTQVRDEGIEFEFTP